MRRLIVLALAAVLGAAGACGEEEATVRPRLNPEAGLPDAGATNEGGANVLACGAPLPGSYTSNNYATNAAVELALGDRIRELDAAMANTEGTSSAVVATAALNAIFNAGAPSLRTVASSFTQTTVDGYLGAFGEAGNKLWDPVDAAADGGAATGGKYKQLFYESRIGVDLRAATGRTLLGGALYNHVLGIVATPLNDVNVDRVLAAFGATPSLANRTDVDAGVDGDRLLAELASKRGIYPRMRSALLAMKGAIAGGPACEGDLRAAIASFLLDWERSTYASAIFSLNAASAAAADPAKGPLALHAYGDALGLVQSFKGLPGDKRKITDAQIDALLTKIGADTPYKLVTDPGTRAIALTGAINDIALYEGFDAAAVETFKTNL